MFKLQTTPTYWQEVSVKLPGEQQPRTFKAEFKRLDTDALEAFRRRIVNEKLNDVTIAHEMIVGWDNVNDENNNKIAFAPDTFDALLAIHPVPGSIAVAFFSSVNGAREKN